MENRKIKNNKISKFTFFAEDLCKNGIFESKKIQVQFFFQKKITSKLYKKTSKTEKWKNRKIKKQQRLRFLLKNFCKKTFSGKENN